MMRAFTSLLMAAAILLIDVSVVGLGSRYIRSQDGYLRDRIVKLHNDKGSCTGIQIEAPSHKVYTLTAAHCRLLLDDKNQMLSRDEAGVDSKIDFIEEDPTSDLLLLTAPNELSVRVSDSISKHEHVHAITHGKGYDSFRTDGEVAGIDESAFPFAPIFTAADEAKCNQPKMHIFDTGIFGRVCVIVTYDTVTTVKVVPGSSGGPLFNERGQLVGIVSATDGGLFSYMVTLSDIHSFLAKR